MVSFGEGSGIGKWVGVEVKSDIHILLRAICLKRKKVEIYHYKLNLKKKFISFSVRQE